MFHPSETDLPDPPLNASGELQLPPELVTVADRLRREAVSVAESSVPQAAAAPLLRHAAQGDQRTTWRAIAMGVAIFTVCASFAAITLILRHAAELRQPLPYRSAPMLAQPSATDATTSLLPQVTRDVFLSADSATQSTYSELELAAAADSLTPEQRIELLERALDSYRHALTAQQERLLQLQEELRLANEKLQQE
jgi:hypothetical protein